MSIARPAAGGADDQQRPARRGRRHLLENNPSPTQRTNPAPSRTLPPRRDLSVWLGLGAAFSAQSALNGIEHCRLAYVECFLSPCDGLLIRRRPTNLARRRVQIHSISNLDTFCHHCLLSLHLRLLPIDLDQSGLASLPRQHTARRPARFLGSLDLPAPHLTPGCHRRDDGGLGELGAHHSSGGKLRYPRLVCKTIRRPTLRMKRELRAQPLWRLLIAAIPPVLKLRGSRAPLHRLRWRTEFSVRLEGRCS